MISVGKNATSRDAIIEILESLVKRIDNLYVNAILRIENRKGKTIVANSFDPNNIIDSEVKPIKPILSGNTG